MNTCDEKWSWLQASNPLIISSSGGGGHLTAAMSLIEQYQQQQTILAYHTAQKPSQARFSFERLFENLMLLAYLPGMRKLIQWLHQIELPSLSELKQEYAQLRLQQAKTPCRLYVDFLLDWMPNGYMMTALFNLMQRQNHGLSLRRLVKNQGFIDKLFKHTIQERLNKTLMDALSHEKPYDAIISTQALGIPALCRAVAKYNAHIMQHNLPQPMIEIHQFITDIPHQYAKHYLSPMQELEFLDKRFLNIHLLNIHDDISFIPHKHAKKVWFYEPEDNPMIRPSLHRAPPALAHGIRIILPRQANIMILPKERLSVVMLSSANGQISLDYLNSLIALGIEHIALVGKLSPSLVETIKDMPSPQSHIYLLGQLDAASLGELLQNAHLIIVKSGGLSLMELVSFKFHPTSIICLHEDSGLNAHSGLIWEEGNKKWFIQHCQQQHQSAFLANPENILQKYQELKHSIWVDKILQ